MFYYICLKYHYITNEKLDMIKIENGINNYTEIDSIQYSYFAGNNYLGLANHPVIVQSAIDSLKKYGGNFSASRQTTGTSNIHLKLEKSLAKFCGQQNSVVFATGYIGNMILMDRLKNRYSIIFVDESAHPSIKDGIPQEIPFYSYKHCDTDHLEKLFEMHKGERVLVISDGIFALTGDIAPLDRIYPLVKKYNALLVVDDAHSIGVLGANGRGTPEYFNIQGEKNIYQTGTMSKALGAYGGSIAADNELINDIRSHSSFYGASTSLPPPIAAAGYASLKLIKKQPKLRDNLIKNAILVRQGIKKMGYQTSKDPTPIIPILFDRKEVAENLSKFLKQNYTIVPAIDYPTRRKDYMVRITVSSSHTKEQIDNLLYILKIWNH